MLIRPPHIGWLLVLGWALAILLAARSAFDSWQARRVTHRAGAIIDSLAALECVPVKPGSEIRVFPPRRDTLKRAQP